LRGDEYAKNAPLGNRHGRAPLKSGLTQLFAAWSVGLQADVVRPL
jgi:hypothetical protein